ncbi:hypothetical protein QYG89_02740 [Bacillus sp. B190/17]|uniref:DUF4064 domain-containing protein n=1 Tax=Bacillus lumedeiriae TaxID=3058829 RepID=A0ABW8I5Z1_9BACI
MQIYSLSSIAFSFIGMLFIGLSFVLSHFNEYLFAMGLIFSLAGVVVSVRAITKGETGIVKYIAIAAFGLVNLTVIWAAPFHYIQLFTWVKNWPIIEQLLVRIRES